ncbi:UDP-glucose--hexose-1-phosphate uridylyltransferase [Parvibacter caecicola]|uniref:UDP-glucose--hexose-1-phosphate uridylyltransferase n=1 Tax=Parvibacter caecicola TaxID=747645 RepID=UPI00249A2096|nr:UDP-glucose--hexose-1-phosphate uridylyltransferase [Parvibacter caecicola]
MNAPAQEGFALPEPDEVRAEFSRRFARRPESATDYLYQLGVDSGYIKLAAPERNICWESASPWGPLELTINCSKPEKDPRVIAAAAGRAGSDSAPSFPRRGGHSERSVAGLEGFSVTAPSLGTLPTTVANKAAGLPQRPARPASSFLPPSGTPQCDLCWENEIWPGSPEHPAKPGLRVAAIALGGETWGLQYSPYGYFPEHCIALSTQHRPMAITAAAIRRLLDFADLFPFYFIGSNADLPIVGGSILSHDHFQGGRHTFPLMKAPLREEVPLPASPQVQAGIVDWPASTLRLRSVNREQLLAAAVRVLEVWEGFSFPPASVLACGTDGEERPVRHSTLNPIVHREGADYVLHLVLRNNRTDAAHPWGIFHPTEDLHHIKKENIGLIEIMGRAILPGRLAKELPAVQELLLEAAATGLSPEEVGRRATANPLTAPHASWAISIFSSGIPASACDTPAPTRSTALRRAEILSLPNHPTPDRSLADGPSPLAPWMQDAVAAVFAQVLACTGVFKDDETGRAGWAAFLEKVSA